MCATSQRVVSEPRNFGFYAADIGHDRVGFEMRGNLTDQRDDSVDWRGNEDELGTPHGGLRRFRYGVTERLVVKREPGFRATGPQDDSVGESAGARRTRDGTSKQPGR